MEPELFKQEFKRISKLLSNDSLPSELKSAVDVYKKFWNFFILGDSFYFILNHHSLEMEFVSNEVEHVLGYTPSEFNIPFMNEKIHPEDRSWFLTFGETMVNFLSHLPVEKIMK